MKTETRIDYLLDRLATMNGLLAESCPESDEAETRRTRRKGKKGGLFGVVVGEIFFRADGRQRPRIVGITHPSDGHPQEEMAPDFGWFRPLAHNNPTWVLYWPELTV